MNRFDPDNDPYGFGSDPQSAPTPEPEPKGPWNTWGNGRIVGLAALLIAGNFLVQIIVYAAGGGLFAPVLAGAIAVVVFGFVSGNLVQMLAHLVDAWF